ncbi:MAG: HAD family hydrolase [Acidobacteria bacterium]|nr:HAD family hydrolase [Acidobacteriota bacterium]
MLRNDRAILFDLDDTLYPLRHFRLSGFAAVARHVAAHHGVDEARAYRILLGAASGPTRGRELNVLTERLGLDVPVATLVRVIRRHTPTLQLPGPTAATLRTLGRSWKLAIVTNGIPAIQRAKVEALGVEPLVDTVVYASEHGTGEGKPEREPFLAALEALAVEPARAIAVGDDEFSDIFGAARCGLRTIQTREWRRGPFGVVSLCADAVVSRMSDVPVIAGCILPERLTEYAA